VHAVGEAHNYFHFLNDSQLSTRRRSEQFTSLPPLMLLCQLEVIGKMHGENLLLAVAKFEKRWTIRSVSHRLLKQQRKLLRSERLALSCRSLRQQFLTCFHRGLSPKVHRAGDRSWYPNPFVDLPSDGRPCHGLFERIASL